MGYRGRQARRGAPAWALIPITVALAVSVVLFAMGRPWTEMMAPLAILVAWAGTWVWAWQRNCQSGPAR